MDNKTFSQLVKQIGIGKHLPDAVYLHRDAFSEMALQLQNFIQSVAQALKIDNNDWDLVKLNKKEFRLSLLSYPDFYNHSYPALKQSVTVDLIKLQHRITQYQCSDNPPILHRKELMILPDSPFYQKFIKITEEGERAGLYENTKIIGFKQSWENSIKKKGYKLVDGRLFLNSEKIKLDEHKIDRHKTAIVRHSLSSPMKQLAKQGYLNGDYTLFDYGCGRGDDMRELLAHGIEIAGWDPNFYPDGEKTPADIVNIGFVLNVIEDPHERLEALLTAWGLAGKLLVVGVMLGSDELINQFRPYKDGVITTRNTFQKYYHQSEIKGYIERSLDELAVTVAPGIFFIFKDKVVEQNYLQNRYRRHHQWQQLTSPTSKRLSEDKLQLLFTQHGELFNQFWELSLILGRIPTKDEFDNSEQLCLLVGSHLKAHRLLCELYGQEKFEQAIIERKEDLLLYFAISSFEKRKPYFQQSETLKRDIKALFGDYKTALAIANEMLYEIASKKRIEQACLEAFKILPASILNEGHSLIFKSEYLAILPIILRIYVEAGLQLYGEIESVNLIKIHMKSSKLSLMTYDDFSLSVPMLKERVKINMAEQNVDFFDYVKTSERPPLLNKCLLMDKNEKDYKKQKSFDKRLSSLLGVSYNCEVLISRAVFERGLKEENKKINKFMLRNIA